MDIDGIKEIIAKDAQGAVMYFGVNDDYEVVGLKSTKYIRSILKNCKNCADFQNKTII